MEGKGFMGASALKDIGSAKVFTQCPYFLEGCYRVQVKRVVLVDGTKGDSFVIEAKVTQSDVASRPAGMVCAQVIKLTGNLSGLGNVKGFIAACLGVDTQDDDAMGEIDGDAVIEMLKSNALVGMVMDLQCSTKITKEKKQPFTVHNWTLPVDAG